MYDEYYDRPELPSRQTELLRRLQGCMVIKMERFAPFSPTSRENSEIWQTPPSQFFSWCGGPMLVTFDTGLEVRVGSDPELMSVVILVEKSEAGVLAVRYPLRDNAKVYCVDVLDSVYSNETMRAFVGKRIQTFRLLQLATKYAAYKERPREAGLVVVFEDGSDLLLSHGLHDTSDDFSVITPEMIHPELSSKLTEIPLCLGRWGAAPDT